MTPSRHGDENCSMASGIKWHHAVPAITPIPNIFKTCRNFEIKIEVFDFDPRMSENVTARRETSKMDKQPNQWREVE